jgi:16S rRNA (guanine527-N7)-methyltransferase
MPSPVVPPAPSAARDVFGAALAAAERYATILAGAGVERGLIGPREVERLWERHLLNCAVVTELVPEGAGVIDVGSGAGLPGIVIALIRPDVRVTMLEPLLRRSTFLAECVEELGLSNAEVVRGRAEERAGGRTGDVVTARAVAPLGRLVEWTIPLLVPEGRLLALKGDRAQAELAEAGPVLKEFGVRSAEVLQVGHGKVEPPATVVRVIVGRSRTRRQDSRSTPRRGQDGGRRSGRGRGVGDSNSGGTRRDGGHRGQSGQAKRRRKR